MLYSDKLNRAIQIAQSLAKEYQQAQFASAHLLKALLHNEIGLASYRPWARGEDSNFYPSCTKTIVIA